MRAWLAASCAEAWEQIGSWESLGEAEALATTLAATQEKLCHWQGRTVPVAISRLVICSEQRVRAILYSLHFPEYKNLDCFWVWLMCTLLKLSYMCHRGLPELAHLASNGITVPNTTFLSTICLFKAFFLSCQIKLYNLRPLVKCNIRTQYVG